jgi:hypothetical protein
MNGHTLSKLLLIVFMLVFGVVVYQLYPPKIEYISQAEIMVLEGKRVDTLPREQQHLFFNDTDGAIKIIDEIKQERQGRKTIVLTASDRIFDKEVTSISKEVHVELIKRLRKIHHGN